MRAQHAHGKIKRDAIGLHRRFDRHRRGCHIGNHAKAVAAEQLARLLRDVCRRIAQAEKRGEIIAPVLGNHFAGFVGVKAVNHHPVIAEHLAHQPGGSIAQGLRLAQPFKLRDHRADQAKVIGKFAQGMGFELHHHLLRAGVDGAIEQAAIAGEIDAEQAFDPVFGWGAGKGCAQFGDGRGGEPVAQQRARRHRRRSGEIEHFGSVERGLRDAACLVHREQRAERLDSGYVMDRFAITFRQRGLDVVQVHAAAPAAAALPACAMKCRNTALAASAAALACAAAAGRSIRARSPCQ